MKPHTPLWKLVRFVEGRAQYLWFIGEYQSWPPGWSWAGRRVR